MPPKVAPGKLKQLAKKLWAKPPGVGSPMNIVCLILNIVFPGSGTIVCGIMKKDNTQLLIGLIQFLICWGIVGWVWSIYWGILIFQAG